MLKGRIMRQQEILVTGGNGTLGTQLRKYLPDAVYTDLDNFDVTDYRQMESFVTAGNYKMIFHAAAFISPPLIDKEPIRAVDVNIIGTSNVVKLCSNHSLKLMYICTDYVFNGKGGNYREDDPVFPVNKYAWSKLGGECAVRLHDNHIIVRISFGPNVFPYPKAFTDQWTTRESVRVIARKLAFLALQDVTGTYHVGGTRKTVYEYARSLDPEKVIEKMSINDVGFTVPVDTSLDSSKFNVLWNSENKEEES